MIRKVLAVVVLASSISYTQASSAQASPEVEHAASLLEKNFETVAYIKVDVLSSAARSVTAAIKENKPIPDNLRHQSVLTVPFAVLVSGLQGFGPDALTTFENNYGDVLGGAGEFRGPKGLGLTSSKDCFVALPRQGSKRNMESVFDKLTPITVLGVKAWTWEMKPGESDPEATWHLYAAEVKDKFILATDRGSFEAVLTGLLSGDTSVPTIADWSTISGHSFWLFRTFNAKLMQGTKVLSADQITEAKLKSGEVTEAQALAASVAESVGSDASSLVFYSNLLDKTTGQGEVTVRVTTTSSGAAPPLFSTLKGAHRFVEGGIGGWEKVVPLNKPIDPEHPDDEPLLEVLGQAGFGVYI